MAALLQRKNLSLARLLLARTSQLSQSRLVASDTLVELKPEEIGIVYGIPQEHLRRRYLSLRSLEKSLDVESSHWKEGLPYDLQGEGTSYSSFEEPAHLEHPHNVRPSKFRRLQFLKRYLAHGVVRIADVDSCR